MTVVNRCWVALCVLSTSFATRTGAAVPALRSPLLLLRTPHVVVEAVQDPVSGELCGDEGWVDVALVRNARLTVTVDGHTATGKADGRGAARPLDAIALEPGRHSIALALIG